MLQSSITVYPLLNYSFGSKEARPEKDAGLDARMRRLKAKFERDGMRRSVEGILLVHEHGHPHVLMLQMSPTYFKLPGGRLRPGEDEAEGLRRKLNNSLAPPNPSIQTIWDIGECAGTYWRPTHDTVFYPYVPPHISRPKECKKVFVVPLPEKAMFAVPKNMRLVAVPLFELYDNIVRYGPVMTALPSLLSRFRLNIVAPTPAPTLKSGTEGVKEEELHGAGGQQPQPVH